MAGAQTQSSVDRARDEGRAAFVSGLPTRSVPYPSELGRLRAAWFAGWFDAAEHAAANRRRQLALLERFDF